MIWIIESRKRGTEDAFTPDGESPVFPGDEQGPASLLAELWNTQYDDTEHRAACYVDHSPITAMLKALKIAEIALYNCIPFMPYTTETAPLPKIRAAIALAEKSVSK